MTALTSIKNTTVRRWASLDDSWRFAITVFVIARLLYALWSWVVFTIQPVAIQNFELAGEPILSIFILKDSRNYVYHREVNGEILTFRPQGTDSLIDQQTGTVWNIDDGKAIEGQYNNSILIPAKTNPSDIFPYHGIAPYSGTWLALWQRFDANWYLSIAKNGYGSIPGDIHFPPLFPVLMRTFQPVFGSLYLAGLFIAHIAALIAIKLMYDLFLHWGEAATCRRAIIFLVIFPTAFFLFSAYSEPLFLVFALLALKSMNARSWPWAGFWILSAILIRLQGVALLAPMLFLMWRDPPFLRKPAQWAGLIISGIGGLLYLYMRSQVASENTIPFVESELHARLVPPWQSYWYAVETILSGTATYIDILNLVATTLCVVLIVWGWKKIPLEYNIYSAISLVLILTRVVETQPLMSMSRYTLTLFPLFYTLALAGENPLVRRIIVYTSIPLSLYLSGQFFMWGWVA